MYAPAGSVPAASDRVSVKVPAPHAGYAARSVVKTTDVGTAEDTRTDTALDTKVPSVTVTVVVPTVEPTRLALTFVPGAPAMAPLAIVATVAGVTVSDPRPAAGIGFGSAHQDQREASRSGSSSRRGQRLA